MTASALTWLQARASTCVRSAGHGRRGTEHVVDGHDLYRTEIERPYARLDRRAIAGNHHRELCWNDVFLCDALHLRGGNGLDPLYICGEVIVRQVIDERLFEPRRDVAR